MTRDEWVRFRKETGADEWRRLYDEAGSVCALARRLGVEQTNVRYQLRRCGVQIRTSGFSAPKPGGAAHSQWSGGTYRHMDGYIYEYAPQHPAASRAKGYVLQHRLVMEATLGRPLRDTELVHHVNEVKDDNRPENLELFDRSAHMKHHKATALRDAGGRFSV